MAVEGIVSNPVLMESTESLVGFVVSVFVLIARDIAGVVGHVPSARHALPAPSRVEAQLVGTRELLRVREAVDGAALHHVLGAGKSSQLSRMFLFHVMVDWFRGNHVHVRDRGQ